MCVHTCVFCGPSYWQIGDHNPQIRIETAFHLEKQNKNLNVKSLTWNFMVQNVIINERLSRKKNEKRNFFLDLIEQP